VRQGCRCGVKEKAGAMRFGHSFSPNARSGIVLYASA